MQLDEYLLAAGGGYDYRHGFDTPQQTLLREARTELRDYGPPDFVTKASGGQRPLSTTHTPWIGFFDPDESVSPMQGLYVVWLLTADSAAWTLSLNMGTENREKELKERHQISSNKSPGEARVLASLRAEAAAIRSRLSESTTAGWDASINLASKGIRQRRYEAATIIGKTYPLDDLPDEATLRSDLDHACLALEEAVVIKQQLAISAPGTISTRSATVAGAKDRELVFEPGVDRPTTVVLSSREIERTPRHESGLRSYGLWLRQRGFAPFTNVHPRDFIIRGDPGWLGEFKVVYGTDVARATREAHSQLKEYRYFIYPSTESVPDLVAVFSAPITERRVAWLNSEGIAVVWLEGSAWRGCPKSRSAGIAI